MGKFLLKILQASRRIFPDIEIIKANTDKDHVHLLVSIPPKYSVAEVVRHLKGRSAHAMRVKFPFLEKVYYGTDGLWSDGYFVSTIDINEEIIKKYIENQGKEDSGQVKLEF